MSPAEAVARYGLKPLFLLGLLLLSSPMPAGEGMALLLSPESAARLGSGDMGGLWLDADQDGKLELLFVNHISPLALWQHHGRGRITNVIDASGIPATGRDRHGASCADFDNDGDPDLYITNGAGRGRLVGAKSDELWRNEGRLHFAEATMELGPFNPAGRGRSASWVDYDNDGWLDLYVSNFQSDNLLLRNLGGQGFADVTQSVGLAGGQGPSAWSDVDGDGDADLVLGRPLRLFLNGSPARFSDVTRTHVPRGLFAFSLAWGDVDADGDDDLFVTGRSGGGRLLRNDAGRLVITQWRPEESARYMTGAGAVWGDLDNDGDLDLMQVLGGGVSVYENRDGHLSTARIEVVPGADAAVSGGDPALGDIDNDGDLDAAIDRSAGNLLLLNDLPPGRNWLSLTFHGSRSNRMGFGARVEVVDAGRVIASSQYFGDKGRLSSAGCAPLHFGLANRDSVTLRVYWPAGTAQTLHGVTANQALEIAEP